MALAYSINKMMLSWKYYKHHNSEYIMSSAVDYRIIVKNAVAFSNVLGRSPK